MENNNNIDEVRLIKIKSDIPRQKIDTPQKARDYAKQFYFEDISIYESVFIILMDSSQTTIGWAKISQGGVAATVVDIKIILKYIIDTLAQQVILIHNHPTGIPNPSDQDIKLTEKLKSACLNMDVVLLDHIIITDTDKYHSILQ